jgi:hypothetical protein
VGLNRAQIIAWTRAQGFRLAPWNPRAGRAEDLYQFLRKLGPLYLEAGPARR